MENREIKFRAFDDGKMIYQTGALTDKSRFFRVIRQDARLMQFVGLKDDKGIDLYEGDIVKTAKGDVRQIIYSGFAFKMKPAGFDDNTWFHSFEIIGNIYENPGLLK